MLVLNHISTVQVSPNPQVVPPLTPYSSEPFNSRQLAPSRPPLVVKSPATVIVSSCASNVPPVGIVRLVHPITFAVVNLLPHIKVVAQLLQSDVLLVVK